MIDVTNLNSERESASIWGDVANAAHHAFTDDIWHTALTTGIACGVTLLQSRMFPASGATGLILQAASVPLAVTLLHAQDYMGAQRFHDSGVRTLFDGFLTAGLAAATLSGSRRLERRALVAAEGRLASIRFDNWDELGKFEGEGARVIRGKIEASLVPLRQQILHHTNLAYGTYDQRTAMALKSLGRGMYDGGDAQGMLWASTAGHRISALNGGLTKLSPLNRLETQRSLMGTIDTLVRRQPEGGVWRFQDLILS